MIAYLVTLVLFVGLDLMWLGVVAKDFYRSELGPVMAENVNWIAGVAFYIIYAFGLYLFVEQPAIQTGGWWRAFLWGAAFGFFAYATYDLTSLAVLSGFSVKLALVDLAWGTLLSGITAAVAVAIALRT